MTGLTVPMAIGMGVNKELLSVVGNFVIGETVGFPAKVGRLSMGEIDLGEVDGISGSFVGDVGI